jgi:hypothetical protein
MGADETAERSWRRAVLDCSRSISQNEVNYSHRIVLYGFLSISLLTSFVSGIGLVY